MELERLPYKLSICKVASVQDIDLTSEFFFIGKTSEEISLVCCTGDVPANATERDDGWRGFKVRGVLDFSLVGILSQISSVLADAGVGIFAVSTFNTDYILVKEENFARAAQALEKKYTVI